MLKIVQRHNGVLLVAAIIIFYFSVVSLLQTVALRHCQSSSSRGNAVGPRAGIEMRGFTVTAYCPGSCCNGIWAGLTATGKSIEYYTRRKINIAAVDPAVIPMGTLFAYGGREYLAVDIGGKIQGKRIDLLMMNHQATYQFGIKKNQTIMILNNRPPERLRSGARMDNLTRIDPSLHNTSIQ